MKFKIRQKVNKRSTNTNTKMFMFSRPFVYFLPNFYELYKLIAFVDEKMNAILTAMFLERKYYRKRRKPWLLAFSPFPTMLSKALDIRVRH